MRIPNQLVAVVLVPALILAASPAHAQSRIVGEAAMAQAVAQKAEADEEARQLVLRVLDRPDARAAAARAGLNIAEAQAKVAALSGAELQQLAQQASAVESASLAGGATTVVISVTTLLLILIIIILLVK